MNFYTGLLFGLIALKKINGKKESIDFNENFNVSFFNNGRIRIYSVLLKDIHRGNALSSSLSRIDGINKISINNVTGSLLLLFDEEKIDVNMLVPAISRLLDLDGNLKEEVTLKKETRLMYNSLNYAVASRTNNTVDIESSLPIIFIALGLYQLYKTRDLGLPSAITMLYWAYTMINNGR